jgi:hypothetical protein
MTAKAPPYISTQDTSSNFQIHGNEKWISTDQVRIPSTFRYLEIVVALVPLIGSSVCMSICISRIHIWKLLRNDSPFHKATFFASATSVCLSPEHLSSDTSISSRDVASSGPSTRRFIYLIRMMEHIGWTILTREQERYRKRRERAQN